MSDETLELRGGHMNRHILFGVMTVVVVLSTVGVGCGGGSSDTTATPDLDNATSISIAGVTTDTNFTTNGQCKVGFTATNSAGTALLAMVMTGHDKAFVQSEKGGWTTIKASSASVECTVNKPSGYTCEKSGDVTSTKPSGGSGNICGVAVIDDSGSMSSSDPDGKRKDATKALLDSLCESTSNIFGLFDFGAGMNLSFTETRDLLTADASTVSGTPPYVACSSENVTAGKKAIDNQITDSGGTPLYESVLEVCNDVVAKSAKDAVCEGKSKAMVVLSDGQPNSTDSKTAAEDCVKNNSIATATVGLGPGSELDASKDDEAVTALKSLATAGSGVYAAATDASALTPIFDTIGSAVTNGQNFVTIAFSPIPASGTTVEFKIKVGSAEATASVVAP